MTEDGNVHAVYLATSEGTSGWEKMKSRRERRRETEKRAARSPAAVTGIGPRASHACMAWLPPLEREQLAEPNEANAVIRYQDRKNELILNAERLGTRVKRVLLAPEERKSLNHYCSAACRVAPTNLTYCQYYDTVT